jgi:hypothetical protein
VCSTSEHDDDDDKGELDVNSLARESRHPSEQRERKRRALTLRAPSPPLASRMRALALAG